MTWHLVIRPSCAKVNNVGKKGLYTLVVQSLQQAKSSNWLGAVEVSDVVNLTKVAYFL